MCLDMLIWRGTNLGYALLYQEVDPFRFSSRVDRVITVGVCMS